MGDSSLAGARIGFFTSITERGGSEVLVADAVESAVELGAEVVVWCGTHAALRAILQTRLGSDRITYRDWPLESGTDPLVTRGSPFPRLQGAWRRSAPGYFKQVAGFLASAWQFRSEVAMVRPSLLYVNVNGSEAVSLAGKTTSGLVVLNCYHLSHTQPRGGLVARLADSVLRASTLWSGHVAVHTSLKARDEWCAAYRYPHARTRVIYNGVDDRQTLTDLRPTLGLAARDFVFCVPGRLHAIKGHAHLIEAMRLAQSRLAHTKVLICGDGELRTSLEAQARDAGLGGQLHFLGWRTDLPGILEASDCAVLASVESENLSVAILESLMAGVPAIVTRVGGMPEAVKDGHTGYVVEPRDPHSLAEAMVRMAADPAAAERMGKAARADAVARFTRTRMKADYQELFLTLASRQGRIPRARSPRPRRHAPSDDSR